MIRDGELDRDRTVEHIVSLENEDVEAEKKDMDTENRGEEDNP